VDFEAFVAARNYVAEKMKHEVNAQEFNCGDPSLPQPDFWQGITSGLPVNQKRTG
jgi:hypothetical protein